ncbi:MAG: bifunctional phosphoglucose/phosphomannose isomerase [Candidatus Thorarchaeota archaeon]|nr:MAG: bifunctional phosphoglucose/phosphomannose isomerase [Candidatus Thorarchaeota archaeon]
MSWQDSIDTTNMRSMVSGFPQLLRSSRPNDYILQEAVRLHERGIDGILLLGMGGSAIAGEICRAYLHDKTAKPILSVRDYTIPQFINDTWVTVAVSYSGNTEETLSAFKEAQSRGSSTIAFTTGATLKEYAGDSPVHILWPGFQPRAALPMVLSGLLPVLEILLDLDTTDLDTVSVDIEHVSSLWAGMQTTPADLAKMAKDAIPLFIGWRHLIPVAYRARCQMNENAKKMAFSSELPEANHNEIEGTASCVKTQFLPVFLRSNEEDKRIQTRIEATIETFIENGCSPVNLDLELPSRIHESLGYTHFLDSMSVELAEILGVDPMHVERITELKKKLEIKT